MPDTIIPRLDLRGQHLSLRELKAALPRAEFDVEAALDAVRPIVADVAERGAAALYDAAERFDGIRPARLRVPAEVIADIFRNRWSIEVFFRMFKYVLGCRHQLSQNPAGLEIQAYCAIIACMLIAIWTGRKPTQRTFEMVGWYMIGMANDRELTEHIESLKMQSISKTPE